MFRVGGLGINLFCLSVSLFQGRERARDCHDCPCFCHWLTLFLIFARSVNYFMYTLTPPPPANRSFSLLSLILYRLWLRLEVVCTGGREIYESRSTERPDAPVPTVSMLPEKNNELATPHPRCSRARKIVNIYYFLLCCKIVRCMWRRTC